MRADEEHHLARTKERCSESEDNKAGGEEQVQRRRKGIEEGTSGGREKEREREGERERPCARQCPLRINPAHTETPGEETAQVVFLMLCLSSPVSPR